MTDASIDAFLSVALSGVSSDQGAYFKPERPQAPAVLAQIETGFRKWHDTPLRPVRYTLSAI